MDLRALPALNALLNTSSALLLARGYFLIRSGRREAHKKTMTAALCVSLLFLVSYLIYHAQAGSVKFHKGGLLRVLYFSVLITHTILAALAAPLALVTAYRAWRGRFEKHKSLARVTLPVWLYVSVSGVIVYFMLYHL